MKTKPVEAELSRIGMWVGVIVMIGSRIIQPDEETAWFVVGSSLAVIGLLILPKHPSHYQDLDDTP